ncbi:hypothetical protein [Belnapia sp. F-4-1]|uniref:hypothetical protein n=1 Tax=Belnapia sp. F-4-1 TaxID=1545443 RepID=UPI001364A92F|nr:hypothetical protein [Belnapia sp. F-4-1]
MASLTFIAAAMPALGLPDAAALLAYASVLLASATGPLLGSERDDMPDILLAASWAV